MKSLKPVLLIIISTIAIFVVLEGVLLVVHKMSGYRHLDTLYEHALSREKSRLENHHYPENSEKFLKIACFGGSSTWGITSPRTFANILEYELLKTITERKVYIRNFGKTGDTFHLEQAEILKAMIPYYDIFIIYAGQNEFLNAFYEHGGLEKFNVVDHTDRNNYRRTLVSESMVHVNKGNILNLLHDYSRLYAVLYKGMPIIKHKINGIKRKFLKKSNAKANDGFFTSDSKTLIRPNITEKDKVLSPAEIDAISKNYENDLNEIVLLARKHGKIIIYVSVCSNEMLPPYYSVCTPDDDLQDICRLNTSIEEVEVLLRQDNISSQAEHELKALVKEFPKHAYVNYLLGSLLFRKAEYEMAWKYLEISVSEDGFPHRAMPAINYLARNVADKSDGTMIYVDHRSQVRKLLEGGMSVWDLFSDWYHPSFLNHILMARDIICAMSEIKRVQIDGNSSCKQLSCNDAFRLAERYENEMEITRQELDRELRRVVRWALRLSRVSAHPQGFYSRANMLLPQYFYDRKKNSINMPLLYAARAYFLALLGEPCRLIEEHFNKALKLDRAEVESLLDRGIDVVKGKDIIMCLEKAGLYIERDGNSQIVRVVCSN